VRGYERIESGGLGNFPNGIYKVNVQFTDEVDDNIAKLFLAFESNFHRATLNFFNF
jgi:hypothetical protein